MISKNKLAEINEYVDKHGFDEAKDYFRITHDTLSRYQRWYRQYSSSAITDEVYNNPNILILDIETAPMESYIWGLWKQNINFDFLTSDWFMLSWAAMWLTEENVYSDVLTGEEALAEDDGRICKSIWELINIADIVVAHHGKAFDIPKLKTRFLINGLQPITPIQIIDTLLIAKKVFGFASNKLDQINRQLGLERKIDTDATLWVRCRKGDNDALQEMRTYNVGDVRILKQTYLKFRAWMPSHPNYNAYNTQTEMACPICGSVNITLDNDAHYVTHVSKFPIYRCNDCGAPFRSRTNELSKEKRDKLTISLAR